MKHISTPGWTTPLLVKRSLAEDVCINRQKSTPIRILYKNVAGVDFCQFMQTKIYTRPFTCKIPTVFQLCWNVPCQLLMFPTVSHSELLPPHVDVLYRLSVTEK